MAEHITAGEFDRFSKRLFTQLDSIEQKQDITNGRVTSLETEQQLSKRLSAKVSAGISIAVTGIINGLFAAFNTK